MLSSTNTKGHFNKIHPIWSTLVLHVNHWKLLVHFCWDWAACVTSVFCFYNELNREEKAPTPVINNSATQTPHLENVSVIPWEINLEFSSVNHGYFEHLDVRRKQIIYF